MENTIMGSRNKFFVKRVIPKIKKSRSYIYSPACNVLRSISGRQKICGFAEVIWDDYKKINH